MSLRSSLTAVAFLFTPRSSAVVVLLVLSLLGTTAHAADVDGDGYEKVLFPLAYRSDIHNIPGAFGTVWTGEVWVDNRNDTGLAVWQCEVPIVCPLRIEPRTMRMMREAFYLPFRPEMGFLLYIPSEQAQNVTFSNRIFERTLRTQPRGIDIPVVREGEFFDSIQTFLGVPAGPAVRVALRVYDTAPVWFAVGSERPNVDGVEVEILDEAQNRIAATTLRPELLYPTTPVQDAHKPGFAAIYDLAAMFPEINAHDVVHVRVNSVPAGAQYWAMVSVTDNETQAVSIITAQ